MNFRSRGFSVRARALCAALGASSSLARLRSSTVSASCQAT